MNTRFAFSVATVAFTVISFGQSFSSSFEPTAYAVGNLTGQNGWVAGSGTTNIPTVTNNVFHTGTQSVQLNGNPGTGSTFTSSGIPFAAGLPAANPLLSASAWLFVDNIAADRYFGFQFGTAATVTTTSLGIALSGNGLRGGGGSYANFNGLTTGLLQARTTADFLGRWVQLSVSADRSQTTNNVTYTFAGLGTVGGNATESFTTSVNFGTQNISHLSVIADWSNSGTGSTGLAFIDDLNAQVVPEPATMVALGFGAIALLRRRKKA